jgi:hypothetical protein
MVGLRPVCLHRDIYGMRHPPPTYVHNVHIYAYEQTHPICANLCISAYEPPPLHNMSGGGCADSEGYAPQICAYICIYTYEHPLHMSGGGVCADREGYAPQIGVPPQTGERQVLCDESDERAAREAPGGEGGEAGGSRSEGGGGGGLGGGP